MNAQWDEQVVEFIHDEFLHALDRILEFCIGGISPNVGLSHLCGDELGKRTVEQGQAISCRRSYVQKIVDDLDLVVDGKRPLCEIAEEAGGECCQRHSGRGRMTCDLRYFATGSAPRDFIWSRKD